VAKTASFNILKTAQLKLTSCKLCGNQFGTYSEQQTWGGVSVASHLQSRAVFGRIPWEIVRTQKFGARVFHCVNPTPPPPPPPKHPSIVRPLTP